MERVEFLEGVNRKEDKAWNELYQYFYAPLCCYSARITRNENAAEDIVQGCLVRLWHSSVCFGDFTKNGWIGSSKMRKKEWQWL